MQMTVLVWNVVMIDDVMLDEADALTVANGAADGHHHHDRDHPRLQPTVQRALGHGDHLKKHINNF